MDLPTESYDGKNWNEILALNHGGAIGLLIDNVITVAGPDGFQQLYTIFREKDQLAKATFLCQIIKFNPNKKDFESVIKDKLQGEKAAEYVKILQDIEKP